jgi:hypothetical protein
MIYLIFMMKMICVIIKLSNHLHQINHENHSSDNHLHQINRRLNYDLFDFYDEDDLCNY